MLRTKSPLAATHHHKGDRQIWLCGERVVRTALANPARTCRTVIGLPARLAQLSDQERQNITVRETDHAELTRRFGTGTPHQGLALLALKLSRPSLDAMIAPEGEASLLVLLDQVTDPRNLGAVLRACAAFGVDAVVVTHRHAPGESDALARAAAGSLECVPIAETANLASALQKLGQANYFRLGLTEDGAQMIGTFAGETRQAMVFGAEGKGLRTLTRARCDALASLPTRPEFPTLNIASAAACALMAVTSPF